MQIYFVFDRFDRLNIELVLRNVSLGSEKRRGGQGKIN